jgi:RNA polymerase sigma-70 factor (ECF subfamily)
MDDWAALASTLGRDDLGAALKAFYESGRTRWTVFPPVPATDFVAHLAAILPPDADDQYLASLVAEDVYLACACADGVPGALVAFDEQYLARVGAFVAHIDNSPEFVQEIRQMLRERLLVRRPDQPPRIATYSGRGALMVWVRVSAARAALDVRAKPDEARRVDDSSLLDGLQADPNPEVDILRARHTEALTNALRAAVASLPAEQRVILRMYFQAGQNTERIATVLRVDRSTAARRLVAARKAVFDETRRLMALQLPVDTAEFRSLARAVHDQINISLTGLLGGD